MHLRLLNTEMLVVLFLLGTFFWIWTVLQIAHLERTRPERRNFWIALVAVTHLFGAAAYWLHRHLPAVWRSLAANVRGTQLAARVEDSTPAQR